MATVFSRDSDTYTPTLVTGYRSSRDPGTLLHDIPGSMDRQFTERPATRRAGTMTVLFASATAETDSAEFEAALSTGEAMDLESDDRETVQMTFYATRGTIDRELEDATRDAWLVTFGFVETAGTYSYSLVIVDGIVQAP